MLMMRPWRSFIMRRTHSLDMRKLAVRLVSITGCQSSSFMRSSRLSRVMAALFTRMVGMSPAASSDAIRASIDASALTSSTSPRPPCSCSAAVICAAPSAEVAVPMTFAPSAASFSAMARPMPREAPVTSAEAPCSGLLMGLDPCAEILKGQGQRRVEGGAILQRHALQFGALVDASVQSGEHLARPALHQRRAAGGDQLADERRPAHRTCELADHQPADLLRAGMMLRIDRAPERDDRFGER